MLTERFIRNAKSGVYAAQKLWDKKMVRELRSTGPNSAGG